MSSATTLRKYVAYRDLKKKNGGDFRRIPILKQEPTDHTTMTGEEFRAAIKDQGFTLGQFAELMGVHRTVIGRVCKTEIVEPHWAFALAGLIASRSAYQVKNLVADYTLEPTSP